MARKAKVDTTADNVEKDAAVTFWLNEIEAAKKREKDYRKVGQEVLDLYSGKTKHPFAILYSNTETLLPALYSTVPRPVVQRRFKDEDPLGKHAATAGQRMLEFLLDTNVDGYETFDEAVKAATLDGLLPGRGITCVKYDADVVEQPVEEGKEATSYKKSELVCADSRSWNRVLFGYAKKWSKVPWVAYEEHIDKDEATRLFGEEIAKEMVFTVNEDEDRAEEKTGDSDERNKGERKTACVYQIWDKDARKIKYVAPQFPTVLKEEDDTLELTGFFNCPKPIQFVEKSSDLVPTALYSLYENQAKDLNELTLRISRIAKAIKARGIYDAELGDDIKNLLEADDNELVPADKSSSLAAEKGLQNAIWFAPLDQLIATLTQLYTAREQCKQVIYEITGIADIMRGQSSASETLGAQEIKQGWGKLRLKRLQKEVQRYARDLLRMMLEVAATKFSEETWAKMTGLPFVTSMQRERLDMIAAAAQMSGQPLDDETKAQLQAPVWGQVLKLLRDDMQRAYRIDIETNSTVEAEATEDQKNIAELMNALAQYLNGITPLVVSGALPFEAAQSMLLAISRRFRFGMEIEDYIKAMKPPKPPDEGDKEAKRAEMQMKQQEGQQKLQEGQMKLQGEQMKQQAEMERQQIEKEKMLLQAEIDREMMMMERECKREEHMMKMAEMRSKHEVGMAAGQMKMAQMKEMAKKPKANGAKHAAA